MSILIKVYVALSLCCPTNAFHSTTYHHLPLSLSALQERQNTRVTTNPDDLSQKVLSLDVAALLTDGVDILPPTPLHPSNYLISEGEALAITNNPSQLALTAKERELYLYSIIKVGTGLLKEKKVAEKDLGRKVTMKEWGGIVEMKPSEIRRAIVLLRAAKSEIVSANFGLVHAVIHNNVYLKNKATYEELFQEGVIGLIRAAEIFDPSRGFKFSTFATVWVKGVLSNFASDPIRIPQRVKATYNKLQRMKRANPEVTLDELSLALEIPADDLQGLWAKVTHAKYPLSVDKTFSNNDGQSDGNRDQSLNDLLVEEQDLDFAAAMEVKLDVLTLLTQQLNEREQRLMRLRYGLVDGKARTLGECARCMGLSTERCRVMGKRCLEKLRRADVVDSLMEYLSTVA